MSFWYSYAACAIVEANYVVLVVGCAGAEMWAAMVCALVAILLYVVLMVLALHYSHGAVVEHHVREVDSPLHSPRVQTATVPFTQRLPLYVVVAHLVVPVLFIIATLLTALFAQSSALATPVLFVPMMARGLAPVGKLLVGVLALGSYVAVGAVGFASVSSWTSIAPCPSMSAGHDAAWHQLCIDVAAFVAPAAHMLPCITVALLGLPTASPRVPSTLRPTDGPGIDIQVSGLRGSSRPTVETARTALSPVNRRGSGFGVDAPPLDTSRNMQDMAFLGAMSPAPNAMTQRSSLTSVLPLSASIFQSRQPPGGAAPRRTSLGAALFGSLWTSDSSTSTSFASRPLQDSGGSGVHHRKSNTMAVDDVQMFSKQSSFAMNPLHGPRVGGGMGQEETETHLSSISTCNSAALMAAASPAAMNISMPPSRSPSTVSVIRRAASPARASRSITLLFLSLRNAPYTAQRGSIAQSWLAGCGTAESSVMAASLSSEVSGQSPPLKKSAGGSSTAPEFANDDLVATNVWPLSHEPSPMGGGISLLEVLLDASEDICRKHGGTVLFCYDDILCVGFGVKPLPANRDPVDAALDAQERVQAELIKHNKRQSHFATAVIQSRTMMADQMLALASAALNNHHSNKTGTTPQHPQQGTTAIMMAAERRMGEFLLNRSCAIASRTPLFDHNASCSTLDRCLTRPVGLAPYVRQPIHQLIRRFSDGDVVIDEWHHMVERREALQASSARLLQAMQCVEEGNRDAARDILKLCIAEKSGSNGHHRLGEVDSPLALSNAHRKTPQSENHDDLHQMLIAKSFLSDLEEM